MAGGNSGLPTDQNLYSATAGFTVTPGDTTIFGSTHRALWVGTGGNVQVRMVRDGSILIFYNVPSGYLLPVEVDIVYATNTTASNILALR